VVTRLSPRQRQILALIAAGYTNPSIAAQLGITLGTVKKHVEAIRYRLDAENRGHAVLLAMQGGELR
jgi:DNA-binding CsgD family transcriptional regulator